MKYPPALIGGRSSAINAPRPEPPAKQVLAVNVPTAKTRKTAIMQQRDQMHPEDIRNLIIFAVISILMWLSYDHFIARPNAEARHLIALEQKKIAATAPAEILDTAIEKPRPEIIANSPRVQIENASFAGSINLKGARLDDIQLKDYYKTTEKKDRVFVLSPAQTPFPRYVETGWIAAPGTTAQMPDSKTQWRVQDGDVLSAQKPLTISATIEGVEYQKTFTINDDFAFTIDNKIINRSGRNLELSPYALVTEHGLPEDFLNFGVAHEGPLGYFDEKLEERSYKDFEDKTEEKFTAQKGWVGTTGKYWLTAISPAVQGEETNYRFVSSPAVSETTKTRYQSDFIGQARTIKAGETISYKVNVFSGAKKLDLLEKYEEEWGIPHFDLAVDFGWFYFLTKPFFLALNFIYGLTGNFGVAIIIFTLILRIFAFPLTNISYKSFAKLNKVSPEMYTLRHQYKDDKKRLQEELVKLYQKHNVNPMAGCLPILIQIPIFFALYKVLSNTIEMRHAPFFGWINDLSAPDPTTIFNLFGIIPWDPPSFLMIGIWPLLMMFGMILQRNISPPPEYPIQAKLIQLMPYFMTYIMAGFASGLVIYWTFSNVIGIVQQVIIMKSMNVPIHLFSKSRDKKKLEKEIEEGPSVHPSLEMVEHEIEDALDGGDPKIVSKPKPKKKKKK